MKSRNDRICLSFSLALLAPAAHAQFGSGIVYDPTQSAHAIQQTQPGRARLQKWAQELQKWEQHLQKEEQIYTTAYQTMNQVIAAYNLAYQMSRMPQNLVARYKSDFSQWTSLTSISSTSVGYLRHYLGVAQCARSRQSHPRCICLQQRRRSRHRPIPSSRLCGSRLDDAGHGQEPVRQLRDRPGQRDQSAFHARHHPFGFANLSAETRQP